MSERHRKGASVREGSGTAPRRDILVEPPLVEVVIEIPRGSFLKRGTTGQVDFVSPFPCPFNYGSVPGMLGLEGDLLDAVVLGPRLPRGARLSVKAFGAVGFTDRDLYDDKLICARERLRLWERHLVLLFFHFYAFCKGLLNFARRQPGRTVIEGWFEAGDALARARPLREGESHYPTVPF
jgi:inorganic pyrophosphatase